MRYGSAVGSFISCRASSDGRDTARTRTRIRGAVLGQRDRGRAEVEAVGSEAADEVRGWGRRRGRVQIGR